MENVAEGQLFWSYSGMGRLKIMKKWKNMRKVFRNEGNW